MQDSPWPERLDELKAHIDAKRSGGRTAELMGLSAGQVIGAAHRRGWAFKSQPGHKYRKKSGGDRGWRPMPKPQTAKVAIEQPLANVPHKYLMVPLQSLKDSQCHFIPGNDSLYCGQPAHNNSPYCKHCCKIMYRYIPRTGEMNLRPW